MLDFNVMHYANEKKANSNYSISFNFIISDFNFGQFKITAVYYVKALVQIS